jgi:septum site-determining protein MinD
MTKAKRINIVSGKGGTGKTLLTAVLAEMLGNQAVRVIVIDLDIFVRGLTALLYFHRGESLQITSHEDFSVADFFIRKRDFLRLNTQPRLAIQRYRSFDVSPSVSRIDELLNFNDVSPDTRQEATEILEVMLRSVGKEYEYIIFDSRAGYDELIAATHRISDASICVQEEDEISNVTADNLVKQLEEDSRIPIFRIVNKARDTKNIKGLGQYHGSRIAYLGSIPFDVDVMNSFGEKTFWEDISRSLYKVSAAEVWNSFAGKMDFPQKLEVSRVSPFGSSSLEAKLGLVTLRNRILLVYGLTIAVLGIIVSLYGKDTLQVLIHDPARLIALFAAIVGVMMAVFSITGRQAK